MEGTLYLISSSIGGTIRVECIYPEERVRRGHDSLQLTYVIAWACDKERITQLRHLPAPVQRTTNFNRRLGTLRTVGPRISLSLSTRSSSSTIHTYTYSASMTHASALYFTCSKGRIRIIPTFVFLMCYSRNVSAHGASDSLRGSHWYLSTYIYPPPLQRRRSCIQYIGSQQGRRKLGSRSRLL